MTLTACHFSLTLLPPPLQPPTPISLVSTVHVISLLPILQRTLTDIVDVLAALATISSKIAISIGTAAAPPLPPSKPSLIYSCKRKQFVCTFREKHFFMQAAHSFNKIKILEVWDLSMESLDVDTRNDSMGI